MLPAKTYQSELANLKANVKEAYMYWKPNYDLYNEFKRFTFKSSLTDSDRQVLNALSKPQIEFNIMEAFISRLRGEFSKQEPAISVMAQDGAPINPETIQLVENHIRHIFTEANKDGCEYNCYSDSLGGGFSALKVYTKYAHPMSMKQVICFERVFDPTLVGFDPMAKKPTKWDGRFCFELTPKTRQEIEDEYPDLNLDEVSFARELEGFSWSYNNNNEDILMVCDFYKKKKKKVRIVELVTNEVMTKKEYEEFLEKWAQSGEISQPPAILNERVTETDTICRYRFIESMVLEYTETDYKFFPLVFVDGNSIMLRDGTSGSQKQMTRPYVYNAKGIQKLMNVSGQTLANQIEMLVQHKFKVAKESLPQEQNYLEAYTNVQLAQVFVYQSYNINQPDKPLPPPQEVQLVPTPPEVQATFGMATQIMQSVLGSYDASLGINDNQLSGLAIQEGATQANAAAMPYVVSFMGALNQVGNIIVDLIPKYYVTPRTIPVISAEGKHSYVKINQKDGSGMQMDYGENDLEVKVEAGVNFAIQKQRALQQISVLSKANQTLGEFFATEGIEQILDNLEFRGSDILKTKVPQWQAQRKQQQQMMQQMQMQQMQNNPAVMKNKIEEKKLMMDAQQNQVENQLEAAKIANEKQSIDNDTLKIFMEADSARLDDAIKLDAHSAQRSGQAVELAMKAADLSHAHKKEALELLHKVSQPPKENGTSK